jgi:hypothetical protein
MKTSPLHMLSYSLLKASCYLLSYVCLHVAQAIKVLVRCFLQRSFVLSVFCESISHADSSSRTSDTAKIVPSGESQVADRPFLSGVSSRIGRRQLAKL